MRKTLIPMYKKNKIHYTFLYIFLIYLIIKNYNYNKNLLNYNFLLLNKSRNSLILLNFITLKKFYFIYCILIIKNYNNFFKKFDFNFQKNNKILLFLECKIINVLSLKSNFLFKNNSKNQLFLFDSFSVRVDFSLFIILKKYLEYFRIVKYNEYLAFNKKLLRKKKLKHFLRKTLYKPTFFNNFIASILAKKIIVYKVNINKISTQLKINYTFDNLKPLVYSVKKLILLNKL
jgi:hypothetical protein